MSEPDFWSNRAAADAAIREHGELNDVVTRFTAIEEELSALNEKLDADRFYAVRATLSQLEVEQLFTGKYDKLPATIAIYPGAGGEDAEDWARMLFEMFTGYAAKRSWKAKLIDDSPNRRTFEIDGLYAYGYLKREQGVHRLVRISPFDTKGARHTSFALVEVTPVLPEVDAERLVIPEHDLKVDFSRAGGPGGQNVNKVETAVRITHLPTGVVVGCRTERSQQQNRERALSMLKAKLVHLMELHHTEEMDALRTKVKPEWGSQIRSYVLNPYQMVKDHRTNAETTQVDSVLSGDLDTFIEAEIQLESL